MIDPGPPQVRVLVYNVKAFRLGTDRAASLVVAHAPDVALIQDLGPSHRLRRFAGTVGMEAASVHYVVRRSIHNAVLVRPPWRVLRHRLHRFPPDVRFYPRGALIARVDRSGVRLSVVSIHLGLRAASRRRCVEQLVGLSAGLERPVMAGGDFNESPTGNAVTWLSRRLWDAFGAAGEGSGATYPATDPTARIDYLFVDDGLEVARAIVVGGLEAESASDHLALLVDLRVRGLESPESP